MGGGGGQGEIMLVADRVVLPQNTAEQRCFKVACIYISSYNLHQLL